MNSRMEKYLNERTQSNNTPSRSNRNQDLYQEIKSYDIEGKDIYSNSKVIEGNAKEIDIEKIKNYVEKINDDKPVKRKSLLDTRELFKQKEMPTEETKDYDLNSILEKAREKRELDYEKERHKKLRNTQFDILNRIKVYEKEKPEEKEEIDFNTEEKTLIDLINTVALNKKENDLLEDLMPDENDDTIVTAPINENRDEEIKDFITKELTKQDIQEEEIKQEDSKQEEKKDEEVKNIDNSFFTSSMNFSKEDFDGFSDLKQEKTSVFVKIGIVVLIIAIIAVGIVIANFVFDLKLF